MTSTNEQIEWVENLLNCEHESEDELQEKIIKFYSLIEKNTIENMNIKKEND